MKFNINQPLCLNEIGNRDGQEDSIFPLTGEATPDSRLFVVCDGMGGHQHGEVASSIIAATLGEALCHAEGTTITDGDIANAINLAYDRLDEAYLQSNETESNKMGSTLTMLCLHQGGCLIGHIGDSRIYHIRPATKQIVNRTRDHSLVQQLFDMGEITEEEMRTSKKKNVILKAMQPKQSRRVMAELKNITDVKPNDYFYLCSDGMLENMDDSELVDIISKDGLSDNEKINILKNRTEGNADNHSAYLIHIEDVEKGIAPVAIPNDTDDDVSCVEDESITPKVATVRPMGETKHHKVIVTQKKQVKNNNSWLIMAIVALAIIVAALISYWIMNNKDDEPIRQTIKHELPRRTGDDVLNERSSSRRESNDRVITPSASSSSTTLSSSSSTDNAATRPSTNNQHSSANATMNQQIRNAANAARESNRNNANEAIRNADNKRNGGQQTTQGNGGGFTLENTNNGSDTRNNLNDIQNQVTDPNK